MFVCFLGRRCDVTPVTLPQIGTLQACFRTVGSRVKHHGPSGLLSGFRQKFSCRMLFGSEELNSLQWGRTGRAGAEANYHIDAFVGISGICAERRKPAVPYYGMWEVAAPSLTRFP